MGTVLLSILLRGAPRAKAGVQGQDRCLAQASGQKLFSLESLKLATKSVSWQVVLGRDKLERLAVPHLIGSHRLDVILVSIAYHR